MPNRKSPSMDVQVTGFLTSNVEPPEDGTISSEESLPASPNLVIKFTDLPAFLQRQMVYMSEMRKAKNKAFQKLESDFQQAKARLIGSAGHHKRPSPSSIVKSANSLKVSTTKSSGVSPFSSRLGGSSNSIKSNPESSRATSAPNRLNSKSSEPSKSLGTGTSSVKQPMP